MNRKHFDDVCGRFSATTHVVQWGDASVWKVGGKMFAIWGEGPKADPRHRVSFKCSDLAYSILTEQEGINPAPYNLYKAKWVQIIGDDVMDDETMAGYLEDAHAAIAAKLPKKLKAELGLD